MIRPVEKDPADTRLEAVARRINWLMGWPTWAASAFVFGVALVLYLAGAI
jgi:hypothetical protein